MRRSESLLLIAWMLVNPAIAGPGQSLDAICEATKGTYGCDAFYKIPYGSEPITTCFDTSPCGVQILTNNLNICDIINNVMPDTKFVHGYPAWCIEAPRAVREVKIQRAVWVEGKLKGANHITLAIADRIEDEFRNRGFQFKNNKNSVVYKELANKDGWTVLRASEINTESYYDLTKALDACDESGCSDKELQPIMNWFINWIRRDTEIRNGKLAHMLAGWEDTFDGLYKRRIAAIKTAAGVVQTRLKTVSSKVSAVTKNVCQKNACKGKTATGNLNRVSAALKTTKNLHNIVAASNTAEEKREHILYNYLSNIQASYNLDPKLLAPNNFNDLLDDGKFNTLRGIMHGFGTITSELNMYARGVKDNLHPLILLTKHESRSRDALKQINTVLAPKWKTNKELSKTASSRKIRDGFVQIQDIIKNDLQDPVKNLISAIDAFNKDFLKFPLRGSKMEFAFGAIPYDRWFDLQFGYPCRKDVTKSFTEAGFSKSHTWPVFSRCFFTAQKVDLPKQWMPYLKYRFVKQ